MFSLVSGVYDSYFAPTQLNLLVVGASGSGKTALLERLKVTQFTKKPKPIASQSQQDDSVPNNVPESFLPVPLRGPHQTRQLQAQLSSQSLKLQELKKKKVQRDQQEKEQQKPKRRSFLACPAPAKYNKSKGDSSSDEEEEHDVNAKEEQQQQQQQEIPAKPTQNGMGRNSSLDMSLEDVPIGGSETSINGKDNHNHSNKGNNQDTCNENDDDDEEEEKEEEGQDDEEDQEFDLKAKSRMLPLHKIRPTIGQNLGKVEMCGAQCRVWDLGGKMHDLWSRYYPDADAVVFVWKIVDDSNPIQRLDNEDGTNDNDNDDDDDDDWPPVTAEQQLTLLETVRASIADDVPFLIWGHWFPTPPSSPSSPSQGTAATGTSSRLAYHHKPKAYQYDEPYSTASLLPHYHNPLMTIYFGSAKTGAGVRTAMEWLIPTATRQKKFRDKSPPEDNDNNEKA